MDLAREIVGMIDRGEGGEVSLPVYAEWIEWAFVLPRGVLRGVRWVAGVDGAFGGVRRGGERERKER